MRKLIIYDETCPMCNLYTRGLVAADNSGTLSRTGNYGLTDAAVLSRIDRQRAKHEIPLVDLDGGETLYGVDAWLYALGQCSRRLRQVLSLGGFYAAFKILYAFISHNRRIIITAAPGRWQLLDLQPDFQLGHRLLFVSVVFSLVSLLHYSAVGLWNWSIFALLGLQLSLVGAFIATHKQFIFTETMLDYCGHLGMSLLVGGVLTAVAQWLHWPTLTVIGYALSIGQHFIRTYRLGLSPWLSVSFTGVYMLIVQP